MNTIEQSCKPISPNLLTLSVAQQLEGLNTNREIRNSLAPYTLSMRERPEQYFEALNTVGQDRNTLPRTWKLLTRDNILRDVIVPGASMPPETLYSLINEPQLFPNQDEPQDEIQQQKRVALKAYLGSPLQLLSSGLKRPNIADIEQAFNSTYFPLAQAILQIVREDYEGIRPGGIEKLRGFYQWYEDKCNYDGVPYTPHPDVVAYACELQAKSKEAKLNFQSVRRLFEMVEKIVYPLDIKEAQSQTAYTSQSPKPTSGHSVKITVQNASPEQQASISKRREEIEKCLQSLEERLAGRSYSNIEMQSNLTSDGRDAREVRIMDELRIDIENEFVSSIRDNGCAAGPSLTQVPSSLVSTVFNLFLVDMIQHYRNYLIHKEQCIDADGYVAQMPGSRATPVLWDGLDTQQGVYETIQREIPNWLTPENIQNLTLAEMASCFRFLFPPIRVEAQQSAIQSLDVTLMGQTKRLHSRGYVIGVFHERTKGMGIRGIHIRPTMQGGYAVKIDYLGKMLPIEVHRDGVCVFPSEFNDRHARLNVECLVKTEILEILKTDNSDTSTDDDFSNPMSDSQAINDHRNAHLRVMPYGNRSYQLSDSTVNEEVSAWLGISFAELNHIFSLAQMDPRFNPQDSSSINAIEIINRQPIHIREKLVCLLYRMGTKTSASHGRFVDIQPRHGPAYPDEEELIDVTRPLLCELSYVPEYTAENSPTEEIVASSVGINISGKSERDMVSQAPEGTVFSAS